MAGQCKHCGYVGSQEGIEKHAGECPEMFKEPEFGWWQKVKLHLTAIKRFRSATRKSDKSDFG